MSSTHAVNCTDERWWKVIGSTGESLALVDARNDVFQKVKTGDTLEISFMENFQERVVFVAKRKGSYDEIELHALYGNSQLNLSRGYLMGSALDASWRQRQGFTEDDPVPEFLVFVLTRVARQ